MFYWFFNEVEGKTCAEVDFSTMAPTEACSAPRPPNRIRSNRRRKAGDTADRYVENVATDVRRDRIRNVENMHTNERDPMQRAPFWCGDWCCR